MSLRLPRLPELRGNVCEFEWSDGKITASRAYRLRISCPCASCRGQNINVRENIEVLEQIPVGNYAVNFVFSDGHNLGIYTYTQLRGLDESADGV